MLKDATIEMSKMQDKNDYLNNNGSNLSGSNSNLAKKPNANSSNASLFSNSFFGGLVLQGLNLIAQGIVYFSSNKREEDINLNNFKALNTTTTSPVEQKIKVVIGNGEYKKVDYYFSNTGICNEIHMKGADPEITNANIIKAESFLNKNVSLPEGINGVNVFLHRVEGYNGGFVNSNCTGCEPFTSKDIKFDEDIKFELDNGKKNFKECPNQGLIETTLGDNIFYSIAKCDSSGHNIELRAGFSSTDFTEDHYLSTILQDTVEQSAQQLVNNKTNGCTPGDEVKTITK